MIRADEEKYRSILPLEMVKPSELELYKND